MHLRQKPSSAVERDVQHHQAPDADSQLDAEAKALSSRRRGPICTVIAVVTALLFGFLVGYNVDNMKVQPSPSMNIGGLVPESESVTGKTTPNNNLTPVYNLPVSNPLLVWFQNYKHGPISNRWQHYLPLYHNYFRKFRGSEKVVMIEIGVNAGGSINMWRSYFGEGLEYHGVDLNPACKVFGAIGDWVHIHIGSQSDPEFMAGVVKAASGSIDIVLDDGGHKMELIIPSFVALFPSLSEGAVYWIEDLQPLMPVLSYGLALAESLHPKAASCGPKDLDQFCMQSDGVFFHDSVLVISRMTKITKTSQAHIQAGDERHDLEASNPGGYSSLPRSMIGTTDVIYSKNMPNHDLVVAIPGLYNCDLQ